MLGPHGGRYPLHSMLIGQEKKSERGVGREQTETKGVQGKNQLSL